MNIYQPLESGFRLVAIILHLSLQVISEAPARVSILQSSETDISNAFNKVVEGSKAKEQFDKKKKKKEWKKDENYISYEPSDKYSEAGFALDNGFSAQVTFYIY